MKRCSICNIICDIGDYERFKGKYYCLSCFEFEFEDPEYY